MILYYFTLLYYRIYDIVLFYIVYISYHLQSSVYVLFDFDLHFNLIFSLLPGLKVELEEVRGLGFQS